MFKKSFITLLLGVSTVALWPTVTGAVTCPIGTKFHTHGTLNGSPYTKCDGKTVTGSVDIDFMNLIAKPTLLDDGDKLVVTFDPKPTRYSVDNLGGSDDYIATCINKGGNLAEGIQVVQDVYGPGFPNMLFEETFIPSHIPHGEKNTVTDIFGELHFGQNIVCPNSNWEIQDSVPCAVDITTKIKRVDGTIEPADPDYLGPKISCTLDDVTTPLVNECFTISHDSAGNLDGRDYTCSAIPSP